MPIHDLTGTQHGKLTITGLVHQGPNGEHRWSCQCECGNQLEISSSSLRAQTRRACKKCQPPHGFNHIHTKVVREDLTGRTFGKLTVDHETNERCNWQCQCECGRTRVTTTSALNAGHVVACYVCSKNQYKLPPGEASRNGLYSAYRKGAEERCLPFDLTPDQFKTLTSQSCSYCGVAPSQIRRNRTHGKGYQFNGDYLYNGIDRKDNKLGYTIENSVPCCGMCNRAKDILSEQDYLFWLQRSYHHIYSTMSSIDHVQQVAPRLIALSGYAGCGKDTFCRLLIEELGNLGLAAERIAFADVLKQNCRAEILARWGFDILTASREQKELARSFLVDTGAELRAASKGTHFVRQLESRLNAWTDKPREYCILTDLRYDEYGQDDELGWVKQIGAPVVNIEKYSEEGGVVMYLDPPNDQERFNAPRIKAQADYHIVWKDGASETEMKIKVKRFVDYLKYSDLLIKPKRVQGDAAKRQRLEIVTGDTSE